MRFGRRWLCKSELLGLESGYFGSQTLTNLGLRQPWDDMQCASMCTSQTLIRCQVKPIESSYNAYARAYLVSGDPEAKHSLSVTVELHRNRLEIQ